MNRMLVRVLLDHPLGSPRLLYHSGHCGGYPGRTGDVLRLSCRCGPRARGHCERRAIRWSANITANPRLVRQTRSRFRRHFVPSATKTRVARRPTRVAAAQAKERPHRLAGARTLLIAPPDSSSRSTRSRDEASHSCHRGGLLELAPESLPGRPPTSHVFRNRSLGVTLAGLRPWPLE
jgi:hypothetical protein